MSEEKKKLSDKEKGFLGADMGVSDEGVQLSKEELVVGAKNIMKEVNSDREVASRQLPLNLRENIDKRILALGLEDEEAEDTTAENVADHVMERERLSAEEKELLRLGEIYKKKRRIEKYFVLAAAVVCVLAFGITSLGGPEKLFEKVNWTLAGREQTNVDSDGDRILEASNVEEEEAYQQIEDEYGFYPVKPIYKPKGVEFLEFSMGEEIQGIDLLYGKDNEVVFSYFIRPNYRNGSYGTDIEDDVINEYTVHNGNVDITIKQYFVEEVNNNRWSGEFVYQDVHYFIVTTDMEQEEFEKILKNLNFY